MHHYCMHAHNITCTDVWYVHLNTRIPTTSYYTHAPYVHFNSDMQLYRACSEMLHHVMQRDVIWRDAM